MKILRKNDIIAFGVIVLFALIFFLFGFVFRIDAKTVVVKEKNKIVYKDSLSKDETLNLSGNTVVIKDKTVYMKEADCKNQICVHHKKISKKGETIICLPNRVSVEIK